MTIDAIPVDVRIDMFGIMDRYYDCVSVDQFESDLSKKSHIILLRDESGGLVGFSTVEHWFETVDGHACQFVFSGDTIVERAYWGMQTFAVSWIRLVAKLKSGRPDVPMYWFLIVKGHRTYRYLPIFSKSYYPAPDIETPAAFKRLTDYLGTKKFGPAYSSKLGTIHFESSHGHLKRDWAVVDSADRRQRAVQFFLEKNPGYVTGDELACLTEISADNMRPFARRIFIDELLK